MEALAFVFSPHGHCCLLPLLSRPSRLHPSVIDRLGTARAVGESTRANGRQKSSDELGGYLWSRMAKPSQGFLGAGILVGVGASGRATENRRLGIGDASFSGNFLSKQILARPLRSTSLLISGKSRLRRPSVFMAFTICFMCWPKVPGSPRIIYCY